MSKIKSFMDFLKEDNVLEAFQAIKDELSERARSLTEASHLEVAKQFKLTPIVEEKDDGDKDDDDENLSDEEKEAKAAKKAEEEGK
jgi:DNA-binding ferritin-like protein